MPTKRQTAQPCTKRHRDGTVWATGQTIAGVMHGYWEWFRKDGTRMRSGSFAEGEQVGEWTTYDQHGAVYKVTVIKAKTTARKAKPIAIRKPSRNR